MSSTISLELVLPCPDGPTGLGCFCFPDLYFPLSSLFSLPIKPASEIEPLINDGRIYLPSPERDESEVARAAGWGDVASLRGQFILAIGHQPSEGTNGSLKVAILLCRHQCG